MGAPIRTYRDAVDRLLDLFDLKSTDRNTRLARAAVQQAYRELPQRHSWEYFHRRLTFSTTAPYSTGSVTYDHTGGSYERLVTLADGTWPTWARDGVLVIGDVRYDVALRIDDTRITLGEDANPGSDVASTATYRLERPRYLMPVDFRDPSRILDVTNDRVLWNVGQNDGRNVRAAFNEPTTMPEAVSVVAYPEKPGRLGLRFALVPSAAASVEVWYRAMPRPLWIEYESRGTIVTTAGSKTVTGTGTAFSSNMVGSVLRVSAKTDVEPTDEVGSCITGQVQPYSEQHVIESVASATSLTITEVAALTASGVKSAISDPIDVEPTAMWTAVMRMAEAEMSRQLRSKDQPQREADAVAALVAAIENDRRGALGDYASYAGFRPDLDTEAE